MFELHFYGMKLNDCIIAKIEDERKLQPALLEFIGI